MYNIYKMELQNDPYRTRNESLENSENVRSARVRIVVTNFGKCT